VKSYIAPIGYDSTRVTRPILNQGVEQDTKIELLVPTTAAEDSRGNQAINDVRQIIEQIEPKIVVQTTTVPYDDFEAAIEVCDSTIADAEGEIIVIFGGGPRDIFLPLTIASLFRKDQIHSSYQFSDIDGQVRERTLPNLITDIPTETEGTLEAIYDLKPPASLTEITDALDISKSTVTRHVKLFEQQGVVTTETQGKTKVVQLTLTGRLLVKRTQ